MRDRIELALGWAYIILICAVVFQPQTYVFPEEASAALIVDVNGNVVRRLQNWENRNFLKSRNPRVTVVSEPCPVDPEASCVFPDQPNVMYLHPELRGLERRVIFYHEYFHVLYWSRLYVGPLWIDEEVTADLYMSCAAQYYRYPIGNYVGALPRSTEVGLYRAACRSFGRYIV